MPHLGRVALPWGNVDRPCPHQGSETDMEATVVAKSALTEPQDRRAGRRQDRVSGRSRVPRWQQENAPLRRPLE